VVSTKVGRLIRPGRRTGTEIYDGDKSFYLAHPAIATVLTGVRAAAEFEENEHLFRHSIPGAMWQELKAKGLLVEETPVPDN
jgi:D-threo-aldose 1-dehydrogenase